MLILLIIAFYTIKIFYKEKLKQLTGQALFEVKNMHCVHHKSTVENAVNAIDGLSTTANLEKSLLCVNYEG